MGLPEEDLPPVWIRDYDYLYDIGGTSGSGGDGGAGVKVDMPAMKDFAAALRNNLQQDYASHANVVFEDMKKPVKPAGAFQELQWALEQHHEAQHATTHNVTNQGNGAMDFATSAQQISDRYRNTDAYAAARVSDVEASLGAPTTGPAPTDPITPSGSANPPDGRA